MRQCSIVVKRVEKSYVDKLDARKPLDFIFLKRISTEFSIDQNIFLLFLSYTAVQYLMACLLIAVRQEGKRIDTSEVVHELE